MDQLMKILQELRPDVDFENETALITNGILDSFDSSTMSLTSRSSRTTSFPRTSTPPRL